MPLSLGDFLAREPELARLRREGDASRSDSWRLSGAEASMVQMLTSRWERGLAGWLTAAEGDRLAAEFTADAAARGIMATAAAEDLTDGRWYLRFRGGPRGDQLLRLSVTGPVAARREWSAYLGTCARRRIWLVGGVR